MTQISFDPTVVTPASPPTDVAGTLSSAMSITERIESGTPYYLCIPGRSIDRVRNTDKSKV
ncbi:MAG: hypothetical protein IPL32_00045 [Chloracidobacterium sp.]|nr:hypothetical protein [Chloracidobacterium sp.]